MIRILHITPHMGGGVGRVLSGLVDYAFQCKEAPKDVLHEIICLERPEKSQFVDFARDAGCQVMLAPPESELKEKLNSADVVQIEFWNHPALLKLLCSGLLGKVRTLFWCHSSGLHFPVFPKGLFSACHKLVFTSPCSFEANSIAELKDDERALLSVISSGGGMDQLPEPKRTANGHLRAGYVGTLNFSKLNPDFVSLLSLVSNEAFCVKMVGDESNRELLEAQCGKIDRPGLLQFKGYCEDVVSELSEMELFIYLLNPCHYGTAEIALLEAMAMQVVPIVMNNSCESHIVKDGETGFIISNGEQLAERVKWLAEHEQERLRMAGNAARVVRCEYTYARMHQQFSELYETMMASEKSSFDYCTLFGETAAEWFRAFVPDSLSFRDDGGVDIADERLRFAMVEKSKGSAYQFAACFPEDRLLAQWCSALDRLQ